MRQKLAEGFLGKDGEKGRDIKNAGLFDKETAYSLAKKVNGVIHKDPKSDKYHVKHGKGSNVSETAEFDESTAAYAASLEKMANDKKLKGITPKDRETLAKLAAMMKSANEGIEEAALKPLKKLKPRATAARDFKGKAMPEFDYKNRKGTANLHPSQYEKGAIAKAADANPMSANAKAVARTAAAQAKMKEGTNLDELKVKNSDAAMGLEKEISALEKRISKLTPLAKKLTPSGDDANMQLDKAKSSLKQKQEKLKQLMKEAVATNESVDPKVAKAVEALNHLGYMLRGRKRFHSGVKRVETFFRSGNKKLLQGAIDVLDPDIRDDVMGILEPLGFVKNGVIETVAKNTTFSTQNKNRKPSLGQNKLSSAEYQRVKKLKSFNKDDWKWNGDLYIRVEK